MYHGVMIIDQFKQISVMIKTVYSLYLEVTFQTCNKNPLRDLVARDFVQMIDCYIICNFGNKRNVKSKY